MSIAGACTTLSGISVTGFTTNLGIDEIPRTALAESLLPALYFDPGWQPSGGEGFRPLDIALNAGTATLFMSHVAVYKGVGMDIGSGIYGGLVALADNYLSKLADNWLLGDNLLEPLQIVGFTFGLQNIAGVAYYGFRARHRWVLRLT